VEDDRLKLSPKLSFSRDRSFMPSSRNPFGIMLLTGGVCGASEVGEPLVDGPHPVSIGGGVDEHLSA